MPGHVIIVGGGSGARMGAEMPKQFLLLGDVPIIIRTIQQFLIDDLNLEIILVVPADHKDHMQQLIQEYNLPVNIKIIEGGETRFQSVAKGLDLVPDGDSLVAVHDAVRPFADKSLINRLFKDAREHGSAIPVIHVKDSVRSISEAGSKPSTRANLRLVKHPSYLRQVP